jgi:hypothetical protein
MSKLMHRECSAFNRVVVNLYAELGFSIGFNIKNASNLKPSEIHYWNTTETSLLMYEESELFFYLNVNEIPPILIDIVDRLTVSGFCVLAFHLILD